MDGISGALGETLYQTMIAGVSIRFIFAQNNIVIIGTSQGHVLKVFIFLNKYFVLVEVKFLVHSSKSS